MLEIGKVGWVEKPKPVCGPMDAVCRPLAAAVCTSDVHTVWEGAVGERHDMILGHECCAEVVSVGELVRDFKPGDRVHRARHHAGLELHSRRRPGSPCTPAGCWRAGSSPTSRTACSLSSSTSTTPTGTSRICPTGWITAGGVHAHRHGADRLPWRGAGGCAVRRYGAASSVSDRSGSWRWPVRRCGAQRGSYAVGTRPVCVRRRRGNTARPTSSATTTATIDEQVLALDRWKAASTASIIAGGDVRYVHPRRKDPEARRADRQRQLSRQRATM